MPGDHITLVANEHFFGKGPYLERVVFHYVPDLTALYTQFQTGAIDYTGHPGHHRRSLQRGDQDPWPQSSPPVRQDHAKASR